MRDICAHLLPTELRFLPAVTVAAPSISILSLKRMRDEHYMVSLAEGILSH